jgi:hypothetical protein
MRTVAILVVLSTIVFTLSAQVPVKKDLMQMLEKIPPPPATVKDAFAKVIMNNNYGELKCSAEKLFNPIEQEVKGVEAEFAAQPKPGAGSVIPGLSPENAKKMDDPEMKKKMKMMSKEEKMKMAMEMMKSMPPGGPVTEIDSPSVHAAFDEWQKIYNDTQNEFQRSVNEQQEEAALIEEYRKSHSEVDSTEAAEIAKLPQISSGEMSAPDPVKVKEVKSKSADKHIAIANKRLQKILLQWHVSVDHAKARYTVFYQKLAAANYAVDSKNYSTKKVLADAQITILVTIGRLIKQSRSAWEESASWHARRVNIESK